jgi:hypothetical protein
MNGLIGLYIAHKSMFTYDSSTKTLKWANVVAGVDADLGTLVGFNTTSPKFKK